MIEMTKDEAEIAGWLRKVAIARMEELLVGLKAGKVSVLFYQLTSPFSLHVRGQLTDIHIELAEDSNRSLLTAKARAFNQGVRRMAEDLLKSVPKEDE